MHYIHELGQNCLNIFNASEGPKILYNSLSFLVLFYSLSYSIQLISSPFLSLISFYTPAFKHGSKKTDKVLWALSFSWPANMQRTSILALKQHVV
jgi:hypothetical protein